MRNSARITIRFVIFTRVCARVLARSRVRALKIPYGRRMYGHARTRAKVSARISAYILHVRVHTARISAYILRICILCIYFACSCIHVHIVCILAGRLRVYSPRVFRAHKQPRFTNDTRPVYLYRSAKKGPALVRCSLLGGTRGSLGNRNRAKIGLRVTPRSLNKYHKRECNVYRKS